jgi:hypothetical protein
MTAAALETRNRHQVARLAAHRLSTETLLHYAEFLPEMPRAILNAHLHLGMNAQELAVLHRVTCRQMRRRLNRLREILADPCFLLAAQYGPQLPPDFAPLVHDYWIQGCTLREIARNRGESLHRIRYLIVIARSLLLIHLSSRRLISSEQACAALCRQAGGN